ncbi:MAG: hypothetical protein OEV40_11835 [Acidimicrobiia bacterium]|nr:hypothetical protein [Acidimicrobiia bacterium]
MGTPSAFVAPYATIKSRSKWTNPDRPLLEAVLLDDNDPASELVITVDVKGCVALTLYARNLEAGGAVEGRTVRFEDRSALVTASVPVIGYDLDTDALVTGHIDVALTWTTNARLSDLVVEGTAILEPDWASDRTQFSAVRRHPFNHDGLTHKDHGPAW